MFTLKFIHGTTRFVVVVNDEFVIKIAKPFGIFARYRCSRCSYLFKNRKWKKLGVALWSLLSVVTKSYKRSLQANIIEGWCYLRLGRMLTFLAPTFTFGLFNIQTYIHGDFTSNDKIYEYTGMLFSPEGDTDFAYVNPHEFGPDNWKITSKGRLILLDYGGISNDSNTLPKLFFKYREQIEKRLAAQT